MRRDGGGERRMGLARGREVGGRNYVGGVVIIMF